MTAVLTSATALPFRAPQSTAPLAPSDTPDPLVPRLFIGNLVPAISDASLTKLFSRFGTVSNVQRHSRGTFAHLSLGVKSDSADIEKCISTLNRTSWCGTILRVERAQEHFMVRLLGEWKGDDDELMQGTEDGDEQGVNSDGDVEQSNSEQKGDPFVSLSKGKHERFAFPDVETPVELGEFAEHVEDPESHPSEIEMPRSGPTNDTSRIPGSGMGHEGTPRKRPRTAAVSSTLQLFGISLSSNATNDTKPVPKSDEKTLRPHKEPTLAPTKEPASRGLQLEDVVAAEKDPSLVDLGAEKAAAMYVIEKMFPGHRDLASTDDATRSGGTEGCVAYKRLGLYKKFEEGMRGTQFFGDSQKLAVSIRKKSVARDATSFGGAKSDTRSVRRAGLYRKLFKQ